MDKQFFEQLLHEEEGPVLDFKRDQYPFAKATDEQKSELLKDILAFANAWRRATAYILVGVEEVKGSCSKVVGVFDQIDDAQLQEFVNSKTNRPVDFHYRTFGYEGMQVGIIEVPVQRRPTYLNKNYGKLAKGIVYVRRGTSTAQATPDEVASMGAADSATVQKSPILSLEFGDPDTKRRKGSWVHLESVNLRPRLDPLSITPAPTPLYGGSPLQSTISNLSYYEDLVRYAAASVFFNGLGFVIENTGEATAIGAELHIVLPLSEGVLVRDREPIRPSRELHILRDGIGRAFAPPAAKPIVSLYPDHYEIVVRFGRILPKATVWSEGSIYIGAETSCVLDLHAHVYAENLSSPVEEILQVEIASWTRAMQREHVIPLLGSQ